MIHDEQALAKFVEKYINTIESNDPEKWKTMYQEFENYDGEALPGDFGYLMLKVDKDPTTIMKYVPRRFLQYQHDITSYIIPEGTQYISYAAFEDTSITNIVLPDSITELEYVCFAGTNIKTINLHSNVKIIQSAVFHSCKQLESIDLSNVVDLGEDVFGECKNLYRVILPTSCDTVISANCFDGCTKLKQLVFHGTIADFEKLKYGEPEYTLKVHCSDGVYTWKSDEE